MPMPFNEASHCAIALQLPCHCLQHAINLLPAQGRRSGISWPPLGPGPPPTSGLTGLMSGLGVIGAAGYSRAKTPNKDKKTPQKKPVMGHLHACLLLLMASSTAGARKVMPPFALEPARSPLRRALEKVPLLGRWLSRRRLRRSEQKQARIGAAPATARRVAIRPEHLSEGAGPGPRGYLGILDAPPALLAATLAAAAATAFLLLRRRRPGAKRRPKHTPAGFLALANPEATRRPPREMKGGWRSRPRLCS